MNLDALTSDISRLFQSNELLIGSQMVSINRCQQKLQDASNMRFDFYKPYPVFEKFHKLGNKTSIRLLLAANRIGKTYSCLAEFSMHATGNYPDNWAGYKYTKKNLTLWAGGISGVEADDIAERLFDGDSDDAPPLIHESLLVYQNKKTRYYKVKRANGGIANIRIKTYGVGEKKNKHSTWKARHVDCIFLDEEPTMSVFTECCIRITNINPDDHGMIMIAATCTQFSEFVLRFTQKIERIVTKVEHQDMIEEKQSNIPEGEVVDGKVFLLAGLDDARHLTEDVKRQMIANMLPQEIEARSKGMPAIGSGMVYPVLEELITCDAFEIPESYRRIIGMDFGWTDPTALVFGAINDDDKTLYIYFEYSVSQTPPQGHVSSLGTMNLADALFWAPIMADPSGQSSSQKDGEKLMDIYSQLGLRMNKAENELSTGILSVLKMMRAGRLKIMKGRCPKLVNALKKYAYDTNGKLIDGDDHLPDALRYLVMGLRFAVTKSHNIYARRRLSGGGLM
jgi:hypothetical protein